MRIFLVFRAITSMRDGLQRPQVSAMMLKRFGFDLSSSTAIPATVLSRFPADARVCLVTGAGRGVGRCIAVRMAAAGYRYVCGQARMHTCAERERVCVCVCVCVCARRGVIVSRTESQLLEVAAVCYQLRLLPPNHSVFVHVMFVVCS
jgi:hypothetical protein